MITIVQVVVALIGFWMCVLSVGTSMVHKDGLDERGYGRRAGIASVAWIVTIVLIVWDVLR